MGTFPIKVRILWKTPLGYALSVQSHFLMLTCVYVNSQTSKVCVCSLMEGKKLNYKDRSFFLTLLVLLFFQLILLNEDADLHHRHHQAKRNQLSLHNCRFSVQYSAIMRVACWSAPDWKHGTASRVRLYGDAVGNIHFYPTLDRTSILEKGLSLNNVQVNFMVWPNKQCATYEQRAFLSLHKIA